MILRIYTYFLLLLTVFSFARCFNDNINKNIEADRNIAIENKKSLPTVYDYLPVPGNNGLIIITSISYNNAGLSWGKGSDDITPAPQLLYKAVISNDNNVTTADEMDQNGMTVLNWTADISGFGITGLSGNTVYYANVMVMDMDGNRKSYIPVSFTTPAIPPYTGNVPLPGNNGLMIISSITYNSAMLSWTKGSDDATPAMQLRYKVSMSTGNNITTADEMDLNGTTLLSWTADVSGFGIAGLSGNTVYYANVMVMDMDGNRKPYIPVSFITPAAPLYTGNVPIPGNNGLITVGSITYNSAVITWTKGSDDTTLPAQLMYKVVRSNYNNITTVADMELNGNGTVVMDWTADVGAVAMSGLAGNTLHYANVMIKDLDLNIKAYTSTAFTTPGIISMLSAGTYSGDMIPVYTSSPRASIDNKAQARKVIDYPALTCSNVRAFIGISGTDSIKNFPANFGLPVSWPIQGPTGILIGYTWADLFDGSINQTLKKAGVINSFWWSGANADGSFAADNCSSSSVPWSSASNTIQGETGAHNKLDSTWIMSNANNCNTTQELVYLCW